MADQSHQPVIAPLTAQPTELLHLDFTRFVAAFGIVLAHSLEFYFPPDRRVFAHRLTAGLPLFVDVFFIISGFVISFVYTGRLKNGADFGCFMQRRVGRLIPLHLALFLFWLLFYVAIIQLRIPMSHPVSLAPSCLLTTGFLLQSFIYCGGESINGITWSISAEMVMYAVFPLLILSARWHGALTAIFVASLSIALGRIGGIYAWTGFESFLRALPAFIFGIILYGLRHRLARIPMPSLFLCVALLLLLSGGTLGWPMPLLFFLAYLIPVMAIAADTWGKVPTLIKRFAPFGQLTYSLYMIHPVLISILMNALADKILHLKTLPMIGMGAITYSLLMLVSWASFRLYETPLRRQIDGIPLFVRRGGTRPLSS